MPHHERDPREHIFGARGPFSDEQLFGLIEGLQDPKRKLKVDVCFEDFGGLLAGQVTGSSLFSAQGPHPDAPLTGDLAHSYASTDRHGKKLAWRIKLNRRMTAPEQYATLTHELGHIFCGHVGPYDASNPDQDEYGWRDRSQLDDSTKEIEAELVSWLACERADLITGAPLYLKPHLEAADAQGQLAKVDLDIVIRALARIEAHGGGKMKRHPHKQRSSSALGGGRATR